MPAKLRITQGARCSRGEDGFDCFLLVTTRLALALVSF